MSGGEALHRLVRPGAWSLRTRLTALVVGLLAVVSVVIGGVAFVAVRSSLAGNFDAQVQEATQRTVRIFAMDGGGNSNGLGIDNGTILVVRNSSGSEAKYITTASSEVTLTSLSASQVAAIAAAHFPPIPGTDCSFASVDIPGRGTYRFCSTVTFLNQTFTQVLVGLPQSTLERQTAAVLGALALLVLGAIVLAGVSATLVIGRALRPLRRVAGVASNVAQMRLDRGDVHLAQRVPDEDTNPHTEVGQVGAALNNLLDSVDSALGVRQASEEKVRHFVADASHELRTPLASIRGYAELTRRFGQVDETSAHNVERIESEAKRMTSLVEDLLLLARLDAQRELEIVEVDLSRLLVDVVSDAHAASRDHEWDLDLPDEPVFVHGDEAKLHQVFVNLLANARVHTPAGTRVVVELTRPDSDEVVVQVRDDGPGIPESLMPNLFERFVRGDSSRNRNTGGSTGLGLSIVAAVVRAHGGAVEVESEPGATVFAVRLPVHAVPMAAAPESTTAPVPPDRSRRDGMPVGG